VFATRDAATGDVVLSSRPGAEAWGALFELLRANEETTDFLVERPLNAVVSSDGVFDDRRAIEANRE